MATNDKKHVMLSYQWDNKELVLGIYNYLKAQNIRVWMDVQGGMKTHLAESMAEAVENAAVICCFLTPKYQESKNCKLELQYAVGRNVPVIPCMMSASYKPSNWLGITLTDLIWLNFRQLSNDNMNLKGAELIDRIHLCVGDKFDSLLDQQIPVQKDDKPKPRLIKSATIGETKNNSVSKRPSSAVLKLATQTIPEVPFIDYSVDYSTRIPKPVREGPEIHVGDHKLTKYKCEGDSIVRLILGSNVLVTCNQEWFSHDQKFTNFLFIPKITFSNTNAKPVSITEVRGEYEDHDHSWKLCKDVKIGPTTNDDEYKWNGDTIVNLGANKLIGFAVRLDIEVNGEPGIDNIRRARAHKSLPQPLKLKIIVEDTDNKECSLIVEQQNTLLELPTKESAISDWTDKDDGEGLREIIAFVYADDCETDQRTFVSMYIDNDGNTNIRCGQSVSSGTTWYLNNERVESLQSEAREKNVNEISIEEQNGNVLALFDPENEYRMYAIRIEITTATSKTVQTLLLPPVTSAKLENLPKVLPLDSVKLRPIRT